MGETGLHWKARIGSLKWLSVLLGIFSILMLLAGLGMLTSANRNADGPHEVTINQLVNGEIGGATYITFSGLAIYEAAYTEEDDDGNVSRSFYFVIDEYSGKMILIEHHEPALPLLSGDMGEQATITGMTHSMPSDLKKLVVSDEADFDEMGLFTTPELYIEDQETPPTQESATGVIVFFGILLILCVIPFFFPTTVFAIHPIDTTAPPLEERPEVKAKGRFQQLTQLKPEVIVGKKTQKFNNAVANLILPQEGRLMIYIHHIMTTKTYGITVSRKESDWGAFISQGNIISIDPGKLYGWKDQWVIRFEYNGPKGKPEVLFIALENTADQAGVIKLLQEMGFPVNIPIAYA